MGKRKPNQEAFDDDGTEIIFAGTHGMLEELADKGRDPALIFSDLSAGLMPPLDIRHVLEASGPDDLDVGRLIDRYGLAECSIVARLMLSHGMIGDEGKSRALGQETTRALLDSLMMDREKALAEMDSRIASQVAGLLHASRWKNFARHGLLSGVISSLLTLLACGISSYYGLFF